ncbi:MAG: hypothetical protein V4503_12385 [Gemmatimonadota bacterium]
MGGRILALNPSPTEVTTAATGGLLGGAVLAGLWWLRRATPASPRRGIWTAAFTAFAAAAFLGLVVHGLALDPGAVDLLWQPLYFLLGVALALFTVGAVADQSGWMAARRWLPFSLLLAVLFYLTTRLMHGEYLVFVLFEGAALLWALGTYLLLARAGRPGSGWVALGLLLSIVAGVLQASTLQVRLVWPFDHNGLYHVAQLVGVVALQRGLRDLLRQPQPLERTAS